MFPRDTPPRVQARDPGCQNADAGVRPSSSTASGNDAGRSTGDSLGGFGGECESNESRTRPAVGANDLSAANKPYVAAQIVSIAIKTSIGSPVRGI